VLGLFDYPHKIQLQTLDSCNFACPMCPYPGLPAGRERTRMDPNLLTRIIEDVRTAGRRIRLCLMLQNEPLLDRRFTALLAEAHDADDVIESVATVTNGSTLTEELLDRLTAYDRFHLTVSVNATDPERYREVHGVDRFARLDGVLSSWKGPRRRFRLSYVVERATIGDARRFVERREEQGYATRLVPILGRVDAVPVDVGRRIASDEYGSCHYPLDTLNVLADGRVILCCNDWGHDSSFGDLTTQSVSEVWNHPALVAIRQQSIEGRIREASEVCRKCDYPMRSAVRMELESACGSEPDPAESPFGIVEHTTELIVGRRTSTPVVVFDIDPVAARVRCAVDRRHWSLDGPTTAECRLRLNIAHGDRFSFGSLTPTWCPGTVRVVDDRAAGDDEIVLLAVELDSHAPERRLLDYYATDWTRSASRSGVAHAAGAPVHPHSQAPK
jgi:radical SAM protein with 4Fe4S-binding SPASM domain